MSKRLDPANDNAGGCGAAQGGILLLTGSPAGRGHVGEIILRDVVLHIGVEKFFSVAVVNREYNWKPDPAVSGLRAELIVVAELLVKRRFGGLLGLAESFARYVTRFVPRRRKLFERIKDKASGVRSIFAVLDNAMTFSLAHRLANALDVPLVCVVWDPPGYLLQQAGFDRVSRRFLLEEFQRSLHRSSKVAVVSRAMEREYSLFTDAKFTLLRHVAEPCFKTETPMLPATLDSTDWIIAFAGSMYAEDAWRALVTALDEVDWTLCGRVVRLRLLTSKIVLSSKGPANIEFLGMQDSSQLRPLLQACNLAYMPQPFSPHLRELCEKSFPTKLSEYLGAGLPVFVHAPDYSALHEFLAAYPVGNACLSLSTDQIRSTISAHILDATMHKRARVLALDTAQRCFSRVNFERQLDDLVG